MKLTACVATVFVALVPSFALAANGHLDRVIEVEVESTSPNGLSALSVRDTVLRIEEIDYMDRTRQVVLSQHGSRAIDWPIMVDTKTKTATYLNRDSGRYVVLKFAELQ